MALRELVEGECGAANPLVQWASHFSQEKSMLKVGLNHDRLAHITQHGRLNEEQLVDEFLGPSHQPRPAVPQTYNMATLLNELQMTQQATPPAQLHPHQEDDVRVKEWVEEYAPGHATALTPVTQAAGSDWVNDFQREIDKPPSQADQWAREFAPSKTKTTPPEVERWVEEFEQQKVPQNDLASVAKEMTETVTDPELNATEFMDFVKKLSTGEAKINDDSEVVFGGSADGWTGEFLEGAGSKLDSNGGYWNQLENEWQEMSKSEEEHPWLSEYASNPSPPSEYQFQEDNPLRSVQQPLEEGLKRLAEGDLPSAVLLFEVEVQARPDSVRGWQLLGSTQADNEQDLVAIAALQRCLELDASNTQAYMSLAVCYTNESQQNKVESTPFCRWAGLHADVHSYTTIVNPATWGKALDALRSWLQHNPKYSSIVPSSTATAAAFTPSLMTRESHIEVRDMYLAAAQTSPDQVDCDIQVGLGVLFNLSREYDKAVDCFTSALQSKPQDAMLWNKLGATLANSNRSEEAVEAYRKALELLPGFTRSRYNLGVSCINLGANKEAVEHFLTALHLQHHAKGPSVGRGGEEKQAQMSESIWSTLSLALSMCGRHDLREIAERRDLDFLMKEFTVD